jgi:lambda repressor-like predicted transcriptional regulator
MEVQEMHPKDLAVVWERWSNGESLLDLATAYGVTASRLHQALQRYLASKERWVGAA